MNWGLIPEVFFDLIGRILPGSLFLLGALAVHFGPRMFAQELSSALPDANLAFLLVFGLLAYFVAIVLKEIWEFRGSTTRRMGDEPPDPFLGIRSRMPAEASRLLKLQAEKNICEVLLPGLGVLLVWNGWLVWNSWITAARASEGLTERLTLELVLLISGVACWRWRKVLEHFYLRDLASLCKLLSEGKGQIAPDEGDIGA